MKDNDIEKILKTRNNPKNFTASGFGIRTAYLEELRMMATRERKQIRDLIDEALTDFMIKRGLDVEPHEATAKPETIDLGDRTVITVNEAAERLEVKTETVRRYLREGILPGQKVGSQWYVDEKALDGFEKPKVGVRRS